MTANLVYVVEQGEYGEGGAVVGVARSLKGAQDIALSQRPVSGSWKKEDPNNEEIEREWSSGCDYVRIRKCEVQP